MRSRLSFAAIVSAVLLNVATAGRPADEDATALWPLRTIDRSSRGADGVRLGDVDQDGRADIATGWEEGGRIRVAFAPSQRPHELWPSMTVGRVKSPEDAFFCDVDGDGWLDVVSCCEGREQTIFLHLNPGGAAVRQADAWQTRAVSASQKASRWMFAARVDSQRLVVGSKDPHGQIALLDLAQPEPALKQIRPAGWIMSLRTIDMDDDGDMDILYSDRKGGQRGIGWLEQQADDTWTDHLLAGEQHEVMFLDVMTSGQQRWIAGNTRNGEVLLLRSAVTNPADWGIRRIPHPPNSGAGKACALGDMDGDARLDLVCTCGLAKGKHGVYWLSDVLSEQSQAVFHPISGRQVGEKFDRIELRDLDRDGDLDVLTCEERDNLGVIWYENPHRP